jgi:hypothetical protein
MSDADRKAILSRRSAFIAAALASAGVAGGAHMCQPCLSISKPPPPGSAEPGQTPSAAPPDPAAESTVGHDGGVPDAASSAMPRVCLRK